MVSSLIFLRSPRVYILKQSFFSISVNRGFRNITWPLRGSVKYILPLFTSISKNNCWIGFRALFKKPWFYTADGGSEGLESLALGGDSCSLFRRLTIKWNNPALFLLIPIRLGRYINVNTVSKPNSADSCKNNNHKWQQKLRDLFFRVLQLKKKKLSNSTSSLFTSNTFEIGEVVSILLRTKAD